MNTLDHLAELLAKAPAFPEDLQPEEEGSYRCPVCDGEGTVDAEWVTHMRSHNWVGGVQFYGIGEEHKWAEEFYLAARTHFPALLEIARAADKIGQHSGGCERLLTGSITDCDCGVMRLWDASAKLTTKGTT